MSLFGLAHSYYYMLKKEKRTHAYMFDWWKLIWAFLRQVGKDICKDAKADKMFFEYWLEAVMTFTSLIFIFFIIIVYSIYILPMLSTTLLRWAAWGSA